METNLKIRFKGLQLKRKRAGDRTKLDSILDVIRVLRLKMEKEES